MSMTLEQQLALLSLWVYDLGTNSLPANKPDLAAMGWVRDRYVPDSSDGFSFGVFTKEGTNDVVIAFTGTGPGLNIDWAANATSTLGMSATQVTRAAEVFMDVKARFGSASNTDLGGALYGQALPFGDASRAGVTTALSAASRMEHVAQFQVAQSF